MTDRNARDEMVKAIRSYMADEITAFQFDDALEAVMARTKDQTVRTVGDNLWLCYDDCKDHKIVATKQLWDFLNRLLLLLESDAELTFIPPGWKWHWLQAVAAALAIAFALLSFHVGVDTRSLAYALPFGPPSLLIAWLNRRRRAHATNSLDVALTPFPSISSLLSVRRQVRNFTRNRYPQSICRRQVRDPQFNALMNIPLAVAWCLFSPLVLFFQMLPERTSNTQIAIAQPPAAVP